MTTISTLAIPAFTNHACHSERSEESPHSAVAFAVALSLASRYPKASALGLTIPSTKAGFSPWGMLSSPSHDTRGTTLSDRQFAIGPQQSRNAKNNQLVHRCRKERCNQKSEKSVGFGLWNRHVFIESSRLVSQKRVNAHSIPF
jgi:hypothetical protein